MRDMAPLVGTGHEVLDTIDDLLAQLPGRRPVGMSMRFGSPHPVVGLSVEGTAHECVSTVNAFADLLDVSAVGDHSDGADWYAATGMWRGVHIAVSALLPKGTLTAGAS